MKLLLFLIPCLVIATTAVSSEKKRSIINDIIDATNYSYGFTLGEKMLQRNVELQSNAFFEGFYDATSQTLPRLSKERMAVLLDQGAATPETPQAFRLPGQKFLSENKAKEGVITRPSGLQYKVLKVGEGTISPKATDTVLANYRATTIDGKVFSSTYPLGIPTPQEFKVNEGVPGWTEALQLMHEGDHWELYLPANIAYKDSGPLGGQTVIIDVELLEILPEIR